MFSIALLSLSIAAEPDETPTELASVGITGSYIHCVILIT